MMRTTYVLRLTMTTTTTKNRSAQRRIEMEKVCESNILRNRNVKTVCLLEFELVPLPLQRFHFRAQAHICNGKVLLLHWMHIKCTYFIFIMCIFQLRIIIKTASKKATTINYLHGPPNSISYRSICNLYLNKHFCCISFRFLWKYISFCFYCR